jgi:hypothetical protein
MVLFALLLAIVPRHFAGAAPNAPVVTAAANVSPAVLVSGCTGPNAEVVQAIDGPYLYEAWIGCDTGIGFARSMDGGATFGPAMTLPGSNTLHFFGDSWDPAIAVAPDGTVYVSFMVYRFVEGQSGVVKSPVVDASFDHGVTFPQVSALPVPLSSDPNGNWGDRPFIAVAPNGDVYVTWDYGPSYSQVQLLCAPEGSCSFSAGDFNAVIQKSTDGGKTWGGLVSVSPNFPIGGAWSAPLVIERDGTIDVMYLSEPTDPATLQLSPGNEFFTSSHDGGATWSAPVKVGASAGTIALETWWIDGSLTADPVGNLFATWDTQTSAGDIGWLSYSTNGGQSWSDPVRVTPDPGNNEHLVEVTAPRTHTAYVAWQTNGADGYTTYLRPFSIERGWLTTAPITVSRVPGDPSIWPGDTFGISTLDGTNRGPIGPTAVVSWGSAIEENPDAQIYAATIDFGPGPFFANLPHGNQDANPTGEPHGHNHPWPSIKTSDRVP